MPYIKPGERQPFDDVLALLTPLTAGELNYVVSRVAHEYLKRKGKNYTTLNEIIGVFECAKTELYRRIVAPYEEQKIRENGDVK